MAKSVSMWESDDGTLYKSKDEADARDTLIPLVAACAAHDPGWEAKNPRSVLAYLVTKFNFSAKP